jgi:predicted nucleic acid-binding protein
MNFSSGGEKMYLIDSSVWIEYFRAKGSVVAVISLASQWGYILDRKGKIVSTTDLFIAAVAFKKATLLHSDKHFEVIAQEFGLVQEKLAVNSE